MRYYIDAMIKDFPYYVKPSKTMPWTEKMFKISKDTKKLDNEKKALFHAFVK